MSKIRILDESISNIIAAGEVVENPASMIKELVENSLDAKATSIRIEVRNGSRNVRIVDTGIGMEKEDLFLCVERHATSKITSKDDIFNLTSYGFRGEALASIGAVSKLAISTKTKESSVGHKISLNGGKVTRYDEVSRGTGTEIVIKDLFFNTPARLKFLRKKSTEYARLREIVLKEALYNVNVAFTLVLDEREVIKTSGKGAENTILELFGRNTLKNLTKFELGYWGNMEILKSNKESIYVFVNGRYVKSKIIEKAVIDSYYTKLIKGKYPFAIIFYDISPTMVDVNVHPSKKIVKFVGEEKVYKEVLEKLQGAIYADDRGNSINLNIKKQEGYLKDDKSTSEENFIGIKENEEVKNYIEPIFNKDETIDFSVLERMIESDSAPLSKEKKNKNQVIKTEQPSLIEKKESEEELKNKVEERIRKATRYSETYDEMTPKIKILDKEEFPQERKKGEDKEESTPFNKSQRNFYIKENIVEKINEKNVEKDYKIIGQLRDMYILVETNEVLEIYDQHIVHERILYERLKENHYQKSISIQNLLVPIKLELSGYDMEVARDNLEVFYEFGFIVEEFGDNELLIRGIPIFDFRESIEDTFRYILENLGGEDPREKILISMSCKNAIKAGKKLNSIEMKTLIEELHEIGKYSCPHGRPIILKIGFDEMDKKFNRK